MTLNATSLSQDVDMRTSRHMRIDELQSKAKGISVGSEGWNQTHKTLSNTVETHHEALESMGKNLRMLEQQVKAVARVVSQREANSGSSQSFQSLKDELIVLINDKTETILKEVNQQVQARMASNQEIVRRVSGMEERMADTLIEKMEEQTNARNAIAATVDKLWHRCQNIDNEILQTDGRLKEYVNRSFLEAKKMIIATQQGFDAEKVARDRSAMSQQQDLQKLMDATRANVQQLSKDLKGQVEKIGNGIQEKSMHLNSELNKEIQDRTDMGRQIMNQVQDMFMVAKREQDKCIAIQDQNFQKNTSKIAVAVHEVRLELEAEKTTREHAVQDLLRAIQKEKKERDIDEDRLLQMIENTMHTIDKMQRGSAG